MFSNKQHRVTVTNGAGFSEIRRHTGVPTGNREVLGMDCYIAFKKALATKVIAWILGTDALARWQFLGTLFNKSYR